MVYWLNIPAVTDGAELNIFHNNGQLSTQVITNYGGASVYNSGSALHDTGLTFTPGVWQKWEFDFIIDDPTFTLTIDGVSASGLGMNLPGGLGSIQFSQGGQQEATPNPFYVGETTLPVWFTIPGDADNSGVVDATDAAILADNWLAQTDPEDWHLAWGMGDFNADGIVDDKDATLLASNWQEPAAGTSVPEPGLIALLLSGLIGLLIVRDKS